MWSDEITIADRHKRPCCMPWVITHTLVLWTGSMCLPDAAGSAQMWRLTWRSTDAIVKRDNTKPGYGRISTVAGGRGLRRALDGRRRGPCAFPVRSLSCAVLRRPNTIRRSNDRLHQHAPLTHTARLSGFARAGAVSSSRRPQVLWQQNSFGFSTNNDTKKVSRMLDLLVDTSDPVCLSFSQYAQCMVIIVMQVV
jgi:hypothetical protein